MNGITQQVLFSGTKFPENYQKAIFSDITSLVSFFPTLMPMNYPVSGNAFVLIQGSVPITCGNSDYPLPINMRLPDDFPNSPPIVQIPFPEGFKFTVSQVLGADRTCNISKIHQWQPRKTTLPIFVGNIVTYFSQYPPFSPEQGAILAQYIAHIQSQMSQMRKAQNSPPAPAQPVAPQPPKPQLIEQKDCIDLALSQASSIIDQINQSIADYNSALIEKELTNHLCKVVMARTSELQAKSNEKRTAIQSMVTNEIPEFPVPPEIIKLAEDNSKVPFFKETNQFLKSEFHEHNITVDQYINGVRTLHRRHFEMYLYPMAS